jgi:hypothetical protein
MRKNEVAFGRPRTFDNEETFFNTFLEYIVFCEKKRKLPNIAGFCTFCMMHRSTFYEQEQYYPDTYELVQNALEDGTINCKHVTDAFKQFYLKNKFGYNDKQEIDANVSVKKLEDVL